MKTFFCFLIILFTSIPARAQEGMSINGVFYKIGMTKGEVETATPKEVQIKDFSGTGQNGTLFFSIKRRADYFEFLGSVDLTAGKVTKIVRQIGEFNSDNQYAVGKIFYEAMARVKQDDPTASIDIVRNLGTPESGEWKTITLTFGKRQIRFVVPEPGKNISMTIEEILQK